MRILLIAILVSSSLMAFAQNKTGTGGVRDNPHGKTVFSPDSDVSGRTKEEALLAAFTTSLYSQEKFCRSHNTRYIKFAQDDIFMDTYLKLSVLQTTFEADDKCSTVSAYFKCLYTPEVKEKLADVLTDPGMKTHLMKSYKLKKKEAEEILNFFKNLDSKCGEKGDCKVQDF